MKLFLLSEMESLSKTSVNFTLILYNKNVLTLFLSTPLQKHDHHQKWIAGRIYIIIIIVIIIIIYCYFIVHPSHKELCGHLVLLQNTTVVVVVFF